MELSNYIETKVIVEEDGRISLPEIMLNTLGWKPGRVLECVSVDGDGDGLGISLFSDIQFCDTCFKLNPPYHEFKKIHICRDCQGKITELSSSDIFDK